MRCIIPSGEGVVTSVDTETLVTFWIGLKISIASSSINAKHSHLSVCLSRSRLSNGALLDIQKRMCLSLSPVEFGWMSRDRLFSLSAVPTDLATEHHSSGSVWSSPRVSAIPTTPCCSHTPHN